MSNTDSQRLDAMRRQRDGYRNQLRKARTKEETMIKTFKCVEHEEEVLEVYPFTGEEGGRKFSLLMPHVSSKAGIAFDSTTAPALALAILEAAGVESPYYNLKDAVDNLRQHVEREARHTAEAEAQAKLEAEALELMNVRLRASGTTVHLTKATVDPVALEGWLAVARKAREINKENQ